MAATRADTNQDGSASWIALLNYTVNGDQHTETKSFPQDIEKMRHVESWARKREMEVEAGKMHHRIHNQVTSAGHIKSLS